MTIVRIPAKLRFSNLACVSMLTICRMSFNEINWQIPKLLHRNQKFDDSSAWKGKCQNYPTRTICSVLLSWVPIISYYIFYLNDHMIPKVYPGWTDEQCHANMYVWFFSKQVYKNVISFTLVEERNFELVYKLNCFPYHFCCQKIMKE